MAFGHGEYKPGTLMGDALIAHELAHVVQQNGANNSISPMGRHSSGTSALEKDADRSAIGVIASLWGGTKGAFKDITKNTMPKLKSGLQLSRCQKDCYTCVDDLKIENISRYRSGNLYGHRFDLVTDLEYKTAASGGTSDATLKWEEKTNRVYHHSMVPNAWNDMYSLLPTSPTFNPWNNRTKPCPGRETVRITDPPAASVNLPARTLDFRITVESSASGTCTNRSKTVTAKQELVPDGSGGITKQDFTTP